MSALHNGSPPAVFLILAHEVRWQLVYLLAQSDYRVQELVKLIRRPLNLVSYHLKQLRDHQLVSERRSSADARDVYYHLDLAHLQHLYMTSGELLHPVIVAATPKKGASDAASPPMRVLFLCTHNSARSQMAEAIARNLGPEPIEAYSAGTEPGTIHPDTIRTMANLGIDMSTYSSKHLDQFRQQTFDYIITVCDRVREQCPVFPSDPERIHWSFADPLSIDDPDARAQQFQSIARELRTRIRHLQLFFERKQLGR